MICPGEPGYDLDGCDIKYKDYGDRYGIKSDRIWNGLGEGVFQAVIVSDLDTIKNLEGIFGERVVLVYVHSETDAKDSQRKEYDPAYRVYLEHFLAFNHVLIHFDPSQDLYDQVSRMFRAYERGDLPYTTARPVASGRIWDIWDEKETGELPEEIIVGGRGES